MILEVFSNLDDSMILFSISDLELLLINALSAIALISDNSASKMLSQVFLSKR